MTSDCHLCKELQAGNQETGVLDLPLWQCTSGQIPHLLCVSVSSPLKWWDDHEALLQLEILTLWLGYHLGNLAPWRNRNQKNSILMDLSMKEEKQEVIHSQVRSEQGFFFFFFKDETQTLKKLKLVKKADVPSFFILNGHIFFEVIFHFENINNIWIWLTFLLKNLYWVGFIIIIILKKEIMCSLPDYWTSCKMLIVNRLDLLLVDIFSCLYNK